MDVGEEVPLNQRKPEGISIGSIMSPVDVTM